MKTIEQKARAYDEVLNKLRHFIAKGVDPLITRADVQDFFPELKESEDEKVRKEIVRFIQMEVDDEIVGNKWLAWLGKQGDYANFRDKAQVGDRITKNEDGVLVNLSQLKRVAKPSEKKGEQKASYTTIVKTGDGGINALVTRDLPTDGEQNPTDKVEPKFRESEWITNGDYTWKIVEVKPLDYILQSQDGNVVDDTISHVDEQFHSFTIQDAKDGDVLYINNTMSESIMIYKSFNNGIINKHASYNKFGFEGENYLTLNDGYITPAIKEQRDTLMKAMVDAGYTFDFEKKELKKIEPKPEENKGNIGGISSNWSEGDESILESVIKDVMASHSNRTVEGFLCKLNWVKSIKGRIQPKQEWSEEDENRFNNLIFLVECSDENEPTKKGFIDFINRLKSTSHQKYGSRVMSREDLLNKLEEIQTEYKRRMHDAQAKEDYIYASGLCDSISRVIKIVKED
jgi:hypothetical protein